MSVLRDGACDWLNAELIELVQHGPILGEERAVNSPVTTAEIQALLDPRESALDSHHSPHSRATSLLFRRHDLERPVQSSVMPGLALPLNSSKPRLKLPQLNLGWQRANPI